MCTITAVAELRGRRRRHRKKDRRAFHLGSNCGFLTSTAGVPLPSHPSVPPVFDGDARARICAFLTAVLLSDRFRRIHSALIRCSSPNSECGAAAVLSAHLLTAAGRCCRGRLPYTHVSRGRFRRALFGLSRAPWRAVGSRDGSRRHSPSGMFTTNTHEVGEGKRPLFAVRRCCVFGSGS